QTRVPGLAAGGSVETKVNDFQMTKEQVSFDGSLHAQNIFAELKDRRLKIISVDLDDIKVKRDSSGAIESTGNFATQGLHVEWPNQTFQGDIALKGVTMRAKDENNIELRGALEAQRLSTIISGPDSKGISASAASIKTDKLLFNYTNGMVQASC